MASNSISQTLTRRNLWCFSLGTVGRDMANNMFTGYLMTFIMFTRSLTAEQFAVINIFIVAARIFDGFNDPVMGAIVDATRTKWGKFKPWICAGMFLSAVVILSSYLNSFDGWAFVFFIGALYICYSITFTMNDIAYWGMIPSLAPQTNDRNLLTSRTTLCASAGGALIGAIVPTFTAGSLTIGGNAVTAYKVLAVASIVLFLTFQSITLAGVRERPLPPRTAHEKFSFKKIVRVILRNDQLRWAALMFFFYSVSVGMGALSTMYIYFSFGYNGTLLLIFGGISGVAAAAVMLFFAQLSRRFTRRQLMFAAILVSSVGYVIVFLIGALYTGGDTARFLMMAAFMMLAYFGPQIVYLVSQLCISNSIEYNDWKTGNRDEGIIASVRPFITKVGMAVGQLLVTVIYLMLGVTEHTNQISEFEKMAANGVIDEAAKAQGIGEVIAAIPHGTTVGLLACMTLIPLVLGLGTYLIFRFKYKITEQKYDEILRDLEARKAQEEDNAKESQKASVQA